MRISELADRSGVPAATIKYYTREGLLPAGERTGHNQTAYSDEHVARLRLIRALVSVGGLSIASARLVLATIDAPNLPLEIAVGAAHSTVLSDETPASPESIERVRAIAQARGWHTSPANPGIQMAAAAIDAFHDVDRDDLLDLLDTYAEAAERIGEVEVEHVMRAGTPARVAETVVLGTVLGDRLFAGLKRIAQEADFGRRTGRAAAPACRPGEAAPGVGRTAAPGARDAPESGRPAAPNTTEPDPEA